MRRTLLCGITIAVAALLTTGCSSRQAEWTTRAAPEGIATLNGVACPSTTWCYAVGQYGAPGRSAIIVSSDGGHQWKVLLTTRIQLLTIACSDPSTCIVGGHKSSGVPEMPEAFMTTDDGAHWSSTAIPAIYGVDGTACASVNVCFIIGMDGIARTTNGGMTWVSEGIPHGFASIDSVACPTRSFCIIGGSSPGTASPGSSVDSVSHDAGTTWSSPFVAAGPVHSGGGLALSALGAISCYDARHCVGVITSGTTLATGSPVTTSDGGRTWKRGSTTVGWAVSCVRNFCASVGGATTPFIGDAFVSTDGGVDWSPSTISTSEVLLNVSCPSSSHCVAITIPTRKSAVILTYP
jgi:hypothetical protein